SDMPAAVSRIGVVGALKDAGLTALLAFFLLLPLIGFNTYQDIHNELTLQSRWPLLFTYVAIAGVGRLIWPLTVAPWLQRRALRPKAPSATGTRFRAVFARWSPRTAIVFVLIYPALVL